MPQSLGLAAIPQRMAGIAVGLYGKEPVIEIRARRRPNQGVISGFRRRDADAGIIRQGSSLIGKQAASQEDIEAVDHWGAGIDDLVGHTLGVTGGVEILDDEVARLVPATQGAVIINPGRRQIEVQHGVRGSAAAPIRGVLGVYRVKVREHGIVVDLGINAGETHRVGGVIGRRVGIAAQRIVGGVIVGPEQPRGHLAGNGPDGVGDRVCSPGGGGPRHLDRAALRGDQLFGGGNVEGAIGGQNHRGHREIGQRGGANGIAQKKVGRGGAEGCSRGPTGDLIAFGARFHGAVGGAINVATHRARIAVLVGGTRRDDGGIQEIGRGLINLGARGQRHRAE